MFRLPIAACTVAMTLLYLVNPASPSAAPNDHILSMSRDVIAIREAWGRERVTTALELKTPEFRQVHLSKMPTVFPHVCGLVELPNVYWGKEFRAFVVNGTTGNVYLDDDTLHFTSVWARYCSPWDPDHESN